MGIGRRLFHREENAPLQIEVALDDGRSRVREEGLIVGVVPDRLVIDTEEPSLDRLNRAREIAIRAMRNLPETPFKAAGVNIRYRSDGTLLTLAVQRKVALEARPDLVHVDV